jgi:pimeloyl-ACP methyl ester carboxylesterase
MGAELIDDGVLASIPAAGSRFEVVPSTGHFLQLEDPATVNRHILDFLAR